MATLAFYCSGHGHGHARRCEQVIRSFIAGCPDCDALIRTAAPPQIFRGIPRTRFLGKDAGRFDSGAVERDILAIDPRATMEQAARVLRARQTTLEAERRLVERFAPRLIVSDIPFLAGDLAEAIGVPCVGLGNFTWDWIYEPFAASDRAGQELLGRIRESYAKFRLLIRLPLSPDGLPIARQVRAPFISQRSALAREEVRDRLALAKPERTPIVLVGMRSAVSPALLGAVARRIPHILFLHPDPPSADMPPNARSFERCAGLRFADLLKASDLVVAKLGFGIISDAIAARARLLFPRRAQFREDEISEARLAQLLPAWPLSAEEFYNGDWRRPIEALLEAPPISNPPETDGAERAAELIATEAELTV